ncbi:DUF2017 domain-containing protein [Allonocardiopsis opalescens]|uniref:Uncharacterized protein DUF2017 n=1 Tax=Allonocardiopsis opalescens TaxID=1144618 RepID=A0A2T0Q996_9ACTN|nr:DUF2017 domain-containing protein [Allonocardiopsis opalescens]PRY00380.1 uncharacterized protein DUF2017 [Allonocardiopsis opalescens]
MTHGFRHTRRGTVTAELDADETELLRMLIGQLLDLVEPVEHDDELAALVGIGSNTSPPEDPALARLLPDAYRDDPEAAGDFRRYTEDDLRKHKRTTAAAVLDALPPGGGTVQFGVDTAQEWLTTLNDVRLALGTRLDVDEDSYDRLLDLSADDPEAAGLQLYHWLTGLQESLVQAVMRADR